MRDLFSTEEVIPKKTSAALHQALLAGDTITLAQLFKGSTNPSPTLEIEGPNKEINISLFAVLYCTLETLKWLHTDTPIMFDEPFFLKESSTKPLEGAEGSLSCISVIRQNPALTACLVASGGAFCTQVVNGTKCQSWGHQALDTALKEYYPHQNKKERETFLAEVLKELCNKYNIAITPFLGPDDEPIWLPPSFLNHPTLLTCYPKLSAHIDKTWGKQVGDRAKRKVQKWLSTYATAYLRSQLGKEQAKVPA